MAITPAFWMPVVAAANRNDVDAALETIAVKAWALNGVARSRRALHRGGQLRSDTAESPWRTCDHAPVQQGGARP
jgi:hypothetical protein